MDFKKHYRRRMKRLKASFIEPIEQSKAVRKLWDLMGTQGVLIHMARQGRWNVWLAFALALLSLALVMGSIGLVSALGAPWWSWFILAPGVFLSAFIHYALWQSTGRMHSGLMRFVLRLYVIPMLGLMFCLVVGIVVVGLNQGFKMFLEALHSTAASATH